MKINWVQSGVFALLLVWAFSSPKAALAVPVLANGQGGVTCGLCHTAVPHLNSYGRYLLMANLSRGLNKHLQMMQNRNIPVALEVTFNASHPPDPLLPGVHSAIVQFLSAGFVGPNVSYFASAPIVTGGFPAAAIDQVWFAYNGFSHENGSLQIGKFPTPVFAPWTSQSLSLTGYGLAGMHVGLNNATIADNRWGLSYTQFGHLGLIGNVSYLAGAGPIERALSTGGEGTALTGSIQYLSPESRWSGGIAGLTGSYPLPSGASDRYARAAALVSYSSGRYELSAMGMVGHDNNPNDGLSSSADSRGVSFETIYGPRSWLHLDFRYEHTDDGLGTSTVNYVLGSAFSVRPNIIFTAEDRASAGSGPVQNYQLLWAGPWFPDRFPPGSIPPVLVPTAAESPASTPMPMSATPMPMSTTATPTPATVDPSSIANGRSIYFTGRDLNGAQITTAAEGRVYQSCAVCHGPDGAGGIQLADGSISSKLGPQAHMLDQMNPMQEEMKPWTVALFERAISTGVDQNGDQLSPVMPRWKMSERDLHDIALYISTQIRKQRETDYLGGIRFWR